MRVYSRSDETRVRVRRAVHDWTAAGLLSLAQQPGVEADLEVSLRCTSVFLRVGLALFTLIAGAAAVGFVMLLTDLRSERAAGLMLGVLGALALAGADWFVRTYRLYRHGVEEALATGAVGLLGVGVALMAGGSSNLAAATGLAVGAAGAAFLFRRFGFQYAAVLAMVAAALAPLPFDALSREARHLLAATICGVTVALAASLRRAADDDVALSDAELLRSAAVAGVYLSLNIHTLSTFFGVGGPAWFRWATWVLTWLIPLAALRQGVHDRDRMLLRVGAAALLVSLLTNKTYLGWTRQPWDPILLGVLLIAVAVALRHWLASGPGSTRAGFTGVRLLESEAVALQVVGTLSVAAQPTPTRVTEPSEASAFSGGRSGGGGGGGEF